MKTVAKPVSTPIWHTMATRHPGYAIWFSDELMAACVFVGVMDKTVQSWGGTVPPLSASWARPHNHSQVGIFSPTFEGWVSSKPQSSYPVLPFYLLVINYRRLFLC